MKRGLRLLFLALLGYIGLTVAACAVQDRFIYYPDATPIKFTDDAVARGVSITTEDNETLVGYYADASPNCPTLLNFHGNAQHLSGLVPVTRRYGENGVGYLTIAYRGYSGSTGKPSEEGLRKDAEAAYQFLLSEGARPDTIVASGFSLGSSIALGIAADHPVSAVVLGAPFESGTRLGQEMLPILPVGLVAGDTFRSDRLAPQVKAPVLIIHGDQDEIIPPAHSEDLAARFPVPATRIVNEGRRHNTLLDPTYEGQVNAFLAPLFPDCPYLQEPLQ